MTACYGLTELEWDDELDLKSYPVWLLWVQFVPLVRPLYLSVTVPAVVRGTRYGHEMLQSPGTKGFDARLKDGYPYMISIVTTDEERKQREPLFRERIAPFVNDFSKEYYSRIDEWNKLIQPLKEVELEKLNDMQLLLHLANYLQVNQRFWDLHFHLFWAVLPIYIV